MLWGSQTQAVAIQESRWIGLLQVKENLRAM